MYAESPGPDGHRGGYLLSETQTEGLRVAHSPGCPLGRLRPHLVSRAKFSTGTGVGSYRQDRERQGRRARAPKEGFMACPDGNYPLR